MSADDALKDLTDRLTAAAKKNPGPKHELLLTDLRALRDQILGILHEAEDLEFHCYANEKYATPKVELYRKLGEVHKTLAAVARGATDGRYDNEDPLKV